MNLPTLLLSLILLLENTKYGEGSEGYTGSDCNVNGPTPTAQNTVLKFFVMGDTPYDQEVGIPFEGEEYNCIKDSMIPKMRQVFRSASFIGHVGDIKRGNPNGGDLTCTDEVFQSRYDLLTSSEDLIDYVLVVGDNEFNECEGFISGDFNDTAKVKWRQYFTEGLFKNLTGGGVRRGRRLRKDVRQEGTPENFYFEFRRPNNIGVFGVTEPAGDSSYNSINAAWIQKNIEESPALEVIIIFGHANLSGDARKVLPSQIPKIYVKGNDHPDKYCMKHHQDGGETGNFLELTVAPFMASPLLVTVVQENGQYFFHVEETDYGCS